MAPNHMQTRMLIGVVAVRLLNFIRQEAQMDWLFGKYDNNDIIVIDSDNEDDETLTGLCRHTSVVGWALSKTV